MKSEKYRLQKVLEIRSWAKEEATKTVTLSLQKLEQTEVDLNRCQLNLKSCKEKQKQAVKFLEVELNKGLSTNNIIQHRNFLDDLKKQEIELKNEVEKQKKIVEIAKKELDSAEEKLLETVRELKAIETHKTNWQTSEQNEKNRQDQKISDEIGAILHSRKKSSL